MQVYKAGFILAVSLLKTSATATVALLVSAPWAAQQQTGTL
jgi:hypothetical protein